MRPLNYKHLHYFWVVAKTGGIARAGEQLHLTPQSISGQLRVLEDALGEKLLRRVGRNLELTDVGRLVLSYADEIFTLGEELQAALGAGGSGRSLQFRVGVADVVPKSLAYHLLEPAMALPETLRIVAREGRLASLLADLAVHSQRGILFDSCPTPNGQSHRHSEQPGAESSAEQHTRGPAAARRQPLGQKKRNRDSRQRRMTHHIGSQGSLTQNQECSNQPTADAQHGRPRQDHTCVVVTQRNRAREQVPQRIGSE